jgi:hypothetical protein
MVEKFYLKIEGISKMTTSMRLQDITPVLNRVIAGLIAVAERAVLKPVYGHRLILL